MYQTLNQHKFPPLCPPPPQTQYVTHTTASVLTSANLTTGELDDLVETIDKGLVNLKMASDIITKNNGSEFLDAVFNASASGEDQTIESTQVHPIIGTLLLKWS